VDTLDRTYAVDDVLIDTDSHRVLREAPGISPKVKVVERPAELRGAAVALGLALLTILPWTIRNAVRYDGFLLVDGTMSTTLYVAYYAKLFNMDLGFEDWRVGPGPRPKCDYPAVPDLEPLPSAREIRQLFPPGTKLPYSRLPEIRGYSTRDFPAAQRCEARLALRFALANPGVVASYYVRRIYAFWGPNSFLLRGVHRGRYDGGWLDRSHYAAVRNVFLAFYGLVIGTAILSFALRPLPRAVELFGVASVLFTALHVLAVAWSRYRFPLMPMAVIAGSLWLASPRLPAGRIGRFVVPATLVGFAALSVHYVATRLP
jgi:hypothetical protein